MRLLLLILLKDCAHTGGDITSQVLDSSFHHCTNCLSWKHVSYSSKNESGILCFDFMSRIPSFNVLLRFLNSCHSESGRNWGTYSVYWILLFVLRMKHQVTLMDVWILLIMQVEWASVWTMKMVLMVLAAMKIKACEGLPREGLMQRWLSYWRRYESSWSGIPFVCAYRKDVFSLSRYVGLMINRDWFGFCTCEKRA